MIIPLGSRITVYKGHRGWTAIYLIIDGAPTRDAAEAAAMAFRTPYAAGWHDAMVDLLTLWVEQKVVDTAVWHVAKFTDWLRGAVGRLAPGGERGGMTRKSPPRRKTDVAHITVCDAVQRRLLARHGQLGTWKAVGDEIGVAAGTVNRVATTDYRPSNVSLRVKLGLPILKPAPVCECGEVHVSKRCPNKPRPPAKPRTKWKQVAGWAFLVAMKGQKVSAG